MIGPVLGYVWVDPFAPGACWMPRDRRDDSGLLEVLGMRGRIVSFRKRVGRRTILSGAAVLEEWMRLYAPAFAPDGGVG